MTNDESSPNDEIRRGAKGRSTRAVGRWNFGLVSDFVIRHMDLSAEEFGNDPPEEVKSGQSFQPFDRAGGGDAAGANVVAVAQRVAAERAGLAGHELQALGASVVARVNEKVQRAVQGHRAEIAWIKRHQRASVVAVAQRVAADGAGLAGDELQALGASVVARVNEKVQRAVQGHRAEIAWIKRHQRASRVTRATVNTLGLMLQRLPFRTVVGNTIEIRLIEVVPRDEMRQHALVRREEGLQVHRQVADNGQVAQGLQSKFVAYGLDQRAAGQALAAIDDHGAGAAHADAAGKAERQIRAGAALESEDRIQNTRLFRKLDLVLLKARSGAGIGTGALDGDGDWTHETSMSAGKIRGNGFCVSATLARRGFYTQA